MTSFMTSIELESIELESIPSGQSAAISTAAGNNESFQSTRAVKRTWKHMSECWSKLKELGYTNRRKCALQYARASEVICGHFSTWGTKLARSLNSLRQRCTISAWLGIAVALVFGGVGLRWQYVSMAITKWNATKEFQEHCQSLNVSSSAFTPECKIALQKPIPSPPFTMLRRQALFEWRRNMLQTEGQGSGISLDSIVPNAYQPSGHDYLLLFPFLAIFCSLVCLKQPHGMIRRTAASCQRLWQTMPNLRMNPQSVNIETVQSDSEQTQYSTGVANQSTSGLRRRLGRSPVRFQKNTGPERGLFGHNAELLTGIVQFEDELSDPMAQPLLAAISNNLENEAKLRRRLDHSHAVYLTLSDKAMDGLSSMCKLLRMNSSAQLSWEDALSVTHQMRRMDLTLFANVYSKGIQISPLLLQYPGPQVFRTSLRLEWRLVRETARQGTRVKLVKMAWRECETTQRPRWPARASPIQWDCPQFLLRVDSFSSHPTDSSNTHPLVPCFQHFLYL